MKLTIANSLVILFWFGMAIWSLNAAIPVVMEYRWLVMAGALFTIVLNMSFYRLERERWRSLQSSKRTIMAQEEERKELARRLHDETIQVLAALSIELERLNQEMAPGSYQPEAYRQSLAKLKALSDLTLADVRKLAFNLRPSLLDDFGLEEALNWLLRENLEKLGIKITFNHDKRETEIPHEIQLVFFRIAQEVISNIVKHARAKEVKFTLSTNRSRVLLEMTDDGAGFKPEGLNSLQWKHMGVLGMKERVEMFFGKLEIDSSPGKGCNVMVMIPLPENSSPKISSAGP